MAGERERNICGPRLASVLPPHAKTPVRGGSLSSPQNGIKSYAPRCATPNGPVRASMCELIGLGRAPITSMFRCMHANRSNRSSRICWDLTPFSSSLNLQLITAGVIDQTQDFVSGSWRRSGARPSFRTTRQTSEHSAPAAIAKHWQPGSRSANRATSMESCNQQISFADVSAVNPPPVRRSPRETTRILITPDNLAAGSYNMYQDEGDDKNKLCAAYSLGKLERGIWVHIWPWRQTRRISHASLVCLPDVVNSSEMYSHCDK